MVSVENVRNNTIVSFNNLKQDVRALARWIVWNKHEHDQLKQRIQVLEKQIQLLQKPAVTYVASTKAKRVHSATCMHAKRIKDVHRTYFEILPEAKERGYSICECAA